LESLENSVNEEKGCMTRGEDSISSRQCPDCCWASPSLTPNGCTGAVETYLLPKL